MVHKDNEHRALSLPNPYITSVEQIGYDRGIKDGQEEKTIAIALNMLKDDLPLETIARFTGLSIAQLQQLQAENQ
jgi:predicted transposase/invertase (TIGR01784 family)